jgi:hypothetical protein
VKAELRPILFSAVALLALAGCQEKKQAAPSHATAVGEVLDGSVSDAMLPVDTVRSQPPLAPKTEPSAGKGGKAHASDKPASGGETAVEPAADAPADTPPPPPPPPAEQ